MSLIKIAKTQSMEQLSEFMRVTICLSIIVIGFIACAIAFIMWIPFFIVSLIYQAISGRRQVIFHNYK